MAHEFNIKNGFITSGQSYVYQNLTVSGLTLSAVPANDDTLTQILARDSSGNVKYRTASSLGGGSSIFTGGTVSGATRFTGGLSANTISATTYQGNLVTSIVAGNNISVNQATGDVTVTAVPTGAAGEIQFSDGANFTSDTNLHYDNSSINFVAASPSYTFNAIRSGIVAGAGHTITDASVSSFIGGGNSNIVRDSDNSAIIGGDTNTISPNTDNTVILGGNNITANASNSVYIPTLYLTTALNNDDTLTEVLVKDGTGEIKYRSASSLGGGGTTGDYLPLSGGTVTGGTIFTSGLTANTISATSINRVGYVNFNTNPTVPSPTGGTLFYDISNNALAYKPITNNNDVTIQIGQESVIRIYNNSGVQINNGQTLNVTGSTSGAPTVTLAIASGGSNPYYQVDGVATHDIPNGEFGFMTVFGVVRDVNLSAFSNGDDVFLSQTVPGSYTTYNNLNFTGRTVQVGHVNNNGVLGELQLNINNEPLIGLLTETENNVLVGGNASTGTYSFSGISLASSTTINIAPVNGWIVSNTGQNSINPSILSIVYPGQTGVTLTNLATSDATYILLTSAVTITQQTTFPTPQQRRQNIFLGKVAHPGRTSILAINNTVDYTLSPMSSLRDLWAPIKLINQGIIPSANGSNLSFNTTAGTLWGNGINWTSNQLNPNSVSISAKTPASFFYRTQTGGTSGSVSVIDPTKYDVGGVITSMGAAGSNDASNQRIYLYPTGVINVLYGQTKYATLTEAIANIDSENFVVYPNAETTAILIGVLSVRNDIVADGQYLTNPSYAKFTLTSKFGESFGGTGGLSTTTLQQAYDNSTTPEIVINAVLDGLSIKNGTGNSDNVTNLFEGVNASGITTSFIRADGAFSGNGVTASTIYGTTYLNLPSATFTGGTVTGPTNFTAGLTANTISATTYVNLPVSGLTQGSNITITNNGQGNYTISSTGGGGGGSFTGGTVTGPTIFTSGVTANTIVYSIVTLTYAATISVDAVLGNEFKVTLTGNAVLGNPTGAVDGQYLRFAIRQDGSGNRNLTFDTKYRFGNEIGTPSVDLTANKTSYLGIRYNAADDKFDVISFVSGY